MPKPILTDEVLAQLEEEERWSERAQLAVDVDQRQVAKSRKLENAKRGAFQSKLNRILAIILLLLALLIYAIFNL